MTNKAVFGSFVLLAATFALTSISAQAGQPESTRWLISSSAAEEERAQAEARNAQAGAQQAQRAQQERAVQEQAQRAQQERAVQEQAQRAQQERAVQEQAQRAQQERAVQEQAQRAQQVQERQVLERQSEQRQAQETNERARELQVQNAQRQAEEGRANQTRMNERAIQERPAVMPPPGMTGHAPAGIAAGAFAARRGPTPPPLNLRAVPIKTAAPPPYIAPNVTPEQRQRALLASQNLQTHMIPIPLAQLPVNIPQIRNQQLAYYTNNYPYSYNNQPFYINRQNTFVNELGPGYYPSWYNPAPGWRFCNGFVLGQFIRTDLNWLRAGWEPYWGPQPEGFVCESDYIPTPWIYFPAMNAWRQVGYPGYSEYGPPPDYTGPISVEVLEPVRGVFMGPDGLPHRDVINELYFYNAIFYPDYERWGFTNDRGYFCWLNV